MNELKLEIIADHVNKFKTILKEMDSNKHKLKLSDRYYFTYARMLFVANRHLKENNLYLAGNEISDICFCMDIYDPRIYYPLKEIMLRYLEHVEKVDIQ